MKTGIKERLKNAKSPEEVVDLIVKARGFSGASSDTIRKWRKIGGKKLKKFSA